MDSFPPEEVAYEMAHLNDNRGYQQTVPVAIFGLIALFCVILRPFARRTARAPLGLDDWLIIASMVFGVALVITTCLTTKYGIGRHVLAVKPSELVIFGKVNFALQLAYPATLGLAKLSILALYARLFRVAGKIFMFAVWGTAVWIVLWMIGVYLVVFLGCRPISNNWTSICRRDYTSAVTTSVFNIASDVALLVLPQAQIWGLHMPMKRKIGLSVVFFLGVLATAMSIARIPILRGANDGGSPDVTYNIITTYLLTVLEPMIAIICACLPVVQSLLVKGYTSGLGFSSVRSLLKSKSTKTQDSKDSWRKIGNDGAEIRLQTSISQNSLHRGQSSLERGDYELGSMSTISARPN